VSESTPAATVETVEQVVRAQLARALGGRRGMLEAAVPTLVFTVLWLAVRDLRVALVVSASTAVVLLVVRLVQRSTVQFVVNALFGIGVGWLFVTIAARSGGDEDAQALAYFLPGILYNAGYAVVLGLTALVGWPLVGFMIGGVTGDPTGWRANRQVVTLCSRLTWLLVIPCVLRVVAQGPVWLAARAGSMDTDAAVAVLGVLKIAMGWPLTLVSAAAMLWLLRRDRTPVGDAGSVRAALDPEVEEPADEARREA
jgi:hypothetical protein